MCSVFPRCIAMDVRAPFVGVWMYLCTHEHVNTCPHACRLSPNFLLYLQQDLQLNMAWASVRSQRKKLYVAEMKLLCWCGVWCLEDGPRQEYLHKV